MQPRRRLVTFSIAAALAALAPAASAGAAEISAMAGVRSGSKPPVVKPTSPATGSASRKALARSCPRGYVCAWEHYNFTGWRRIWEGLDADWSTGTWNIDNRATSFYNNGITGPGIPSNVHFYHWYFGVDYAFCLRPQSWITVPAGHPWNDTISSHYWATYCNP